MNGPLHPISKNKFFLNPILLLVPRLPYISSLGFHIIIFPQCLEVSLMFVYSWLISKLNKKMKMAGRFH